jgi:hypothetical protein
MLRDIGDDDTVILAGIGGGGVPMVNVALLLRVPRVAVIVARVSVVTAFTVTVATPDALVVAVAAGAKLTAPGELTVNVTVCPAIGCDDAS